MDEQTTFQTIFNLIPDYLDEGNELFSVAWKLLLTIWLVRRELREWGIFKRAKKMLAGVDSRSDEDTLTGKPVPDNPHPALHMLEWLEKEFRAHRDKIDGDVSELQKGLARVEGQLELMNKPKE